MARCAAGTIEFLAVEHDGYICAFRSNPRILGVYSAIRGASVN